MSLNFFYYFSFPTLSSLFQFSLLFYSVYVCLLSYVCNTMDQLLGSLQNSYSCLSVLNCNVVVAEKLVRSNKKQLAPRLPWDKLKKLEMSNATRKGGLACKKIIAHLTLNPDTHTHALLDNTLSNIAHFAHSLFYSSIENFWFYLSYKVCWAKQLAWNELQCWTYQRKFFLLVEYIYCLFMGSRSKAWEIWYIVHIVWRIKNIELSEDK